MIIPKRQRNELPGVWPGNRAVTIIGWDDDYPASNFPGGLQPPENGAWLIKNSWDLGANVFPNRAAGMWDTPLNPADPAKDGSRSAGLRIPPGKSNKHQDIP